MTSQNSCEGVRWIFTICIIDEVVIVFKSCIIDEMFKLYYLKVNEEVNYTQIKDLSKFT